MGARREGLWQTIWIVVRYSLIKKAIEFPVVELHHEVYGYQLSGKTGVKARLLYAVTSVIISIRGQREEDGQWW